eukprot:COSAG04_NODE_2283_length_4389_cov_3.927040_3_plen_36_part_01
MNAGIFVHTFRLRLRLVSGCVSSPARPGSVSGISAS